jgi:hypothetical protein
MPPRYDDLISCSPQPAGGNQTGMLIKTHRQPETHTAFPLEEWEIYLTLRRDAEGCRQIRPPLQQLADGEFGPRQANSQASWRTHEVGLNL